MDTIKILKNELDRLQRLNILLEKQFLEEKNEPEQILNAIRNNVLTMCEIVNILK